MWSDSRNSDGSYKDSFFICPETVVGNNWTLARQHVPQTVWGQLGECKNLVGIRPIFSRKTRENGVILYRNAYQVEGEARLEAIFRVKVEGRTW